MTRCITLDLIAMKTIKIFLASSEELEVERAKLGNLVRRLDKIYEKRGTRIELIEWEDLDAAYNGQRKQDEYNQEIRACDLFLAIFHQKAGKFTLEEFNVATEEFKKHASPKVYAYMKDLAEGEQEQPELTAFKKHLFDEMNHYWCRYGSTDTMQLHFVMQLQLVESASFSGLKLEVENAQVKLDTVPIANLKQVPFAANNQQYIEWKENLAKVQSEIAAFESILATTPNETIELLLGSKRTERYNLQEKLNDLEKSLLGTALTIVSLQGRASSDRLRHAIERFEAGDNMGANAILDPKEIEADAQRNLENFKLGKQLAEEAQKAVFSSIEEYRLRAKNLLTIFSNENRFAEAEHCFDKAVKLAKEAEMPKEDYTKLLEEYADFLFGLAVYNKSLSSYLELLEINLKQYAPNSLVLLVLYNNIGMVCNRLHQYDDALTWYEKALESIKCVSKEKNMEYVKTMLNVITNLFDNGNIFQANHLLIGVENILKTLEVESLLEKAKLDIKLCQLANKKDELFETSLRHRFFFPEDYYDFPIKIFEKYKGLEHPDTAEAYNNKGLLHYIKEDYPKALEWYSKVLAIYEKVFGSEHPITAASYNVIGDVYSKMGNNPKALIYYNRAIKAYEKNCKSNLSTPGIYYENIGKIYLRQQDYNKAFPYLIKSWDSCSPSITLEEMKNACDMIQRLYPAADDRARVYYQFGKAFSRVRYDDRIIESVASCYMNALKFVSESSEKFDLLEYAEMLHNIALFYCDTGYWHKEDAKLIKTGLSLYCLFLNFDTLYDDIPFRSAAYHNIALAYYLLNDNKHAIKWFVKMWKSTDINSWRKNSFDCRRIMYIYSVENMPIKDFFWRLIGSCYGYLVQCIDEDRLYQSYSFFLKAIDILDEFVKKEFILDGDMSYMLSELFFYMNKDSKALEYYTRSAELGNEKAKHWLEEHK